MAFERNGLVPSEAPERWAAETAKPAAGATAKPPVGTAAAPAVEEDPTAVLEAIERQAWGDDPNAVAAEPAAEEQETAPEADPDAPQAQEPDPQTQEQLETEEVPVATPRAQARFQQLANENREMKEMLALMKAEREERAAEAREWREQQKRAQEVEREAQLKNQWDQYLIANGQDPNVPTNQAGFEAIKQVGDMKKMLADIEARQTASVRAAAQERYVATLYKDVDAKLAAHAVSAKQVEAIKRNAYALAAANQIADPAAAVSQALAAYQDDAGNLIFPKKAPRVVKKSQPVDQLIASRGSRGDGQKGQMANGKKRELSLEEMETGAFFLGR